MSLTEARKTYKPFEYPWAYEFWKRQQQVHWMPEEVPLGEDCRDWAQKLSPHERNLLTQIFRFFTQADIEVQDCYHEKYGRVFKPVEVKMMLASFSNMETIHIAAYSHLLDTIGMPESEYGMFLEYQEMRDKHDYLQEFGVDSDEDIARTLAMFGGFTEGLQLFASFAMLMNFPRFNKMKGMGQIVTWSIRDESLHCEGITQLFHAFVKERDCLTKSVKEDIIDCCQKTVRLEDAFIDLAFEQGPVPGMTAKEIKKYIRYVADWRLSQLGLRPIYMMDDHPLPWLTPLLNGVEHANFFETRATEYSKAATRGNWNDVWSSFDDRKKKVSNDDTSPVDTMGKFGTPEWSFENSINEIFFSIPIAGALAIAQAYAKRKQFPLCWLRPLGITNFSGDIDIWDYCFSQYRPNGSFINIRDLENDLIIQGFVSGFSERCDLREVLLHDVTVYDAMGEHLFGCSAIYIAREPKSITMEFCDPEETNDR